VGEVMLEAYRKHCATLTRNQKTLICPKLLTQDAANVHLRTLAMFNTGQLRMEKDSAEQVPGLS